MPWFHSWNKPKSKISKKEKFSIIQITGNVVCKLIIAGKIKAISISKIKKIIVIKKNRKENGRRGDDFWSNPHSKEDIFSRSK